MTRRGDSPLRVLIVDDNRPLATALALIIRELGYHGATAETLDAARSLIASEPFDVILCDASLHTPDDGVGLLAYARDTAPRAVRVLLSGRDLRTPHDAIERFAMKPLLAGELDEILGWASRQRGQT